MKYFYGPVASRRLGFSLGVNLFSDKICTFDCVYCQLGPALRVRSRRLWCTDLKALARELADIVARGVRIDYITISGSGEPTLHKRLDHIIRTIRRVTKRRYPVCVITNSSLLYRSDVRRELCEADLVIPSLDAATKETFARINRPSSSRNFEKIVRGIEKFRRQFKGKMWLEIMLVKGLNDSDAEARAFAGLVQRIRPDKVQLNLPVRPGSEKTALPRPERIEKIRKLLSAHAEVVAEGPRLRSQTASDDITGSIMRYVRVRPATAKDLAQALGVERDGLQRRLDILRAEGRLAKYEHGGTIYYVDDRRKHPKNTRKSAKER